MKKTGCIVSLILLLCACRDTAPGLKGTVSDQSLDGKEIYLFQHNNYDMISADTATIRDGKFVFSGLVEGVYYLLMDDSLATGEIEQGVPLYIGQGKATVRIENEQVIIGGNPENDAFRKLLDADRPLVKKMMDIETLYEEGSNAGNITDEQLKDLNNQMTQLMAQDKELVSEYVHSHIDNPLGEEIFLNYIQIFSPEEIDAILSEADESLRSNPLIVDILSQIEVMKSAGTGSPFIDVRLPDRHGKIVALSDYAGKGKYVLVDFWASWCVPCLQEMPVLKEAYARYKNKSFEIIGISLDEDKKAWLNTIDHLKMNWIQLSDYEGHNAASYTYHVSAIPHTLLIDPQGTIIAKNLRGEALLKQLEELLK
jgi:peroxiredoxin